MTVKKPIFAADELKPRFEESDKFRKKHPYRTHRKGFKPSAGTAAAEAFGGGNDKAARYARLSALLDEWANDKSGFDARVEPAIGRSLKDSVGSR